jgi:hypothetical protein
MKTKRFFSLGLPALLLALVLSGCSTGGDPPFIAVTGISGAPTAAIVGYPLTLSYTVEPANATNQTVVWSGIGVSNGRLTAASAIQHTVTATIANGKESGSYTQNFTITAYNAGSSGTNLFGNTLTPYVWAMDNKGGTVYVTLTDTAWAAKADGEDYNNGNYSRYTGTKAASWTVTGGGHYTGNTGIAIIRDDGSMLVANFTHTYSDMNGTFTQLDTGLTLDGTWVSTDALIFGNYAEMAATSGNFTVKAGDDEPSKADKVKGTYVQNTNPAVCTITEIDIGGGLVAWDTLSDDVKNAFGGGTFTALIYGNSANDIFEAIGSTFTKQ